MIAEALRFETDDTGGLPHSGATRDVAPPHRYHVITGNAKHKRRGERRLMRSRADIEAAIEAHADTVLRACAVYLREKADREDVFQETFLRYACSEVAFADEEHKKAWLIRVAANLCKDQLKSASSRVESLEAVQEDGFAPVGDDGLEAQRKLEGEELLKALHALDEKYRVVLYLKYYEGYTAAEIAEQTGMPENTVYTNLSRGKQQLMGVLNHG